jgi:hypothetical protein
VCVHRVLYVRQLKTHPRYYSSTKDKYYYNFHSHVYGRLSLDMLIRLLFDTLYGPVVEEDAGPLAVWVFLRPEAVVSVILFLNCLFNDAVSSETTGRRRLAD